MRTRRYWWLVLTVGVLGLAVAVLGDVCLDVHEIPPAGILSAAEDEVGQLLVGVSNALAATGLADTRAVFEAGGTSTAYLPENGFLLSVSVDSEEDISRLESVFGDAMKLVGRLMSKLVGNRSLGITVHGTYAKSDVGYFVWTASEIRAGRRPVFHPYEQRDRDVLLQLGILWRLLEKSFPDVGEHAMAQYVPGIGAYFGVEPGTDNAEVMGWACESWSWYFCWDLCNMTDFLASALGEDESLTLCRVTSRQVV